MIIWRCIPAAQRLRVPYIDEVWVPTLHVAVSVDAGGQVLDILGPDVDPPTTWDPGTLLPIPAGGYVVAGGANAWDQSVFRNLSSIITKREIR